MTEEIPQPLPALTTEERAVVSGLTDQEIRAIDEALMAAALTRWRKVAMVVALAMDDPRHIASVPDTFYGQRVCKLVEDGRLEAQGNVEYMRFSEVRLPAQDENLRDGA